MMSGYTTMGPMFLRDLLLMRDRSSLDRSHLGRTIFGAARRWRRSHVVEVIADIVANENFGRDQL